MQDALPHQASRVLVKKKELNRGRREIRETKVYRVVDAVDAGFPGARTIIRTYREVWQTRKTGRKDKFGRGVRKAFGKPTKEVAYHVSHGVFIWLTASIRFQHCTSLKLLPHCQPDGPKAETLPTIPSIQRSKAPPPMSRRPVGTLREHDGRGFGVVPKPLAANHPSSLRHCSPPFIMMRTSFAGCRLRSLFTCSVVLPGRRAQIHIPNDLATIIAAMTFSSQRRVNASSW